MRGADVNLVTPRAFVSGGDVKGGVARNSRRHDRVAGLEDGPEPCVKRDLVRAAVVGIDRDRRGGRCHSVLRLGEGEFRANLDESEGLKPRIRGCRRGRISQKTRDQSSLRGGCPGGHGILAGYSLDVDALSAVGEEAVDGIRQKVVVREQRSWVEVIAEAPTELREAGDELGQAGLRPTLRHPDESGRARADPLDGKRTGVDLLDVDAWRKVFRHGSPSSSLRPRAGNRRR